MPYLDVIRLDAELDGVALAEPAAPGDIQALPAAPHLPEEMRFEVVTLADQVELQRGLSPFQDEDPQCAQETWYFVLVEEFPAQPAGYEALMAEALRLASIVAARWDAPVLLRVRAQASIARHALLGQVLDSSLAKYAADLAPARGKVVFLCASSMEGLESLIAPLALSGNAAGSCRLGVNLGCAADEARSTAAALSLDQAGIYKTIRLLRWNR